mgnify:CR=1 FL=1
MFGLSNWRIEQGEALLPRDPHGAEVLRWQDPATPLNIVEVRTQDGPLYRLRMNSNLAIDVLPDGRIVTRHGATIPQVTIDHFLADQVIPRLLAHSGAFVFHAGAVRFDEAALVFLGRSGRGKSTLVASFDQAGLALLGDDAMVLSSPDGVPHVSPVYPSLRLFPDSLAALMPGAASAGPVAHYSTKQRIDVEVATDAAPSPLPIRALFALDEASADSQIGFRRLAAAEACMLLVESSFALDPADLEQARRRLNDAGALASRVPAFEISYPRDYARLPEVRGAILAQATTLEVA